MIVVTLGLLTSVASGAQTPVRTFQGEAPEQFLHDARITNVVELGEGITRPLRVTLEANGQTHDAVFKSIDERRQGATTLEDGSVEVGFEDTWQTEVAAYQLDLLLGLGMVPATIERRVRRDVGSLQWWVDSMMSEADRVAQGVQAPDPEAWNRQMFKVRLFDELISNTDRHPKNLLVTEDFQVRLIDHSRSFRENQNLRSPELLTRFSKSLLDAIAGLTKETLKDRLGRYVSNAKIDRLLQRRDAIVALARQRVAELGEAAVIYP
jgi:hypothetical protein